MTKGSLDCGEFDADTRGAVNDALEGKGATELIHLTYEGNFQLECSSTVLGCRVSVDGGNTDNPNGGGEVKVELELDSTTMHPQGGGQPTDIGTIVTCEECCAQASIDRVTIDRSTGVVTHAGKVTGSDTSVSPFVVGSKVRVSVDPENRRILSECHTAGHVVDSAMARCDRIMPPSKGYHFLDGPYVEYKGSVPPNERNELLTQLQASFQDLVNEDIATTIETLPKDEAEAICNRLAQNFDMSEFGDDSIRVVTVAGWPCPCGGTHVKSTSDLKERGWGVRGLKCKKGVVRVKYGPNSK